MDIVSKLTLLLEEENILPITDKLWSSFKINHCSPSNEKEKKDNFIFIRDHVAKKAGIYVYMKNDKCIYIGKAKLLYYRLRSHYIESFSTVPGDTKDKRWHRFFSQHQGEVKIFWKEVMSEDERQIIEMLLTKIVKPSFLTFK